MNCRASEVYIANMSRMRLQHVLIALALTGIVGVGLCRGDTFVHRSSGEKLTGYVVGPAYPPSFVDAVVMNTGVDYILQAGMVVTVEPPVFIMEERLGVRLIENVLVTETGGEVLSNFTRDLIVL